jgi:hypothetical protein
MIRNAVAMARFAEAAATVVGDLAQSTRLNLVALTKGEGIATKALMPEARLGANEGTVSFLSLDDPALIVAKASRELKDFGTQLWRAGTDTGSRHPHAGQLLDKADELSTSFAALDARGVQFSMKATPSLRVYTDTGNWKPLVQRADMLDNLVPKEVVQRIAPRDYQQAFAERPWMKYTVQESFDAESKAARLLGFTESRIGRSRLQVFIPVHSAI